VGKKKFNDHPFAYHQEIELEITPESTRVTAQFSELCSISASDWVCKNC